jgi:DNA-binding SARP family transcriptional activator
VVGYGHAVEGGNELVDAVSAALAGGREDDAARLIERSAPGLHVGAIEVRLDVLEQWLDRLRPIAADRPWLLFLQSWVCSSLRQHTAAAIAVRRAADLFARWPPGPDQHYALALTGLAGGVIAERSGDQAAAARAFAGARTALAERSDAAVPHLFSPDDARRWTAHDPSGAAGYWLAAVAALDRGDDPLALARAQHNLAMECLRRGEPTPAARLAGAACEVKRRGGSLASYANSLNVRGMAAAMLGDLAAAGDDLAEAGALAERAGQRLLAAYAENNLAELAALVGDIEQARSRFTEAARRKERIGDDFGLAWTWRAWSAAERLAGDTRAALHLAERAWRLRDPCTDRTEQAQQAAGYGAALVAAGRPDEARERLVEGRALAAAEDAKVPLALALVHLARLDGTDGGLATARLLADRYHLAVLRPEFAAVEAGRRAYPVPDAGGGPTPPPADLRVFVLGEFVVRTPAGEVCWVEWRSKRAASLLRLLVSRRGQWVHRDELIDALWPDAGDGGRGLLNAAVNTVRRELERAIGRPGLVERAGDRYRVLGLRIDADEFEALVTAAGRAAQSGRPMLAETRFQQALGLWRGTEAYPQDRYADWAGPERDRLHGLAYVAREQAAELALARGAADVAAGHALGAVAADPYREAGLRLYLRSELARNDRPAARRAYLDYARRLRDDLGIEPAADLADLLEPPVRGAAHHRGRPPRG